MAIFYIIFISHFRVFMAEDEGRREHSEEELQSFTFYRVIEFRPSRDFIFAYKFLSLSKLTSEDEIV